MPSLADDKDISSKASPLGDSLLRDIKRRGDLIEDAITGAVAGSDLPPSELKKITDAIGDIGQKMVAEAAKDALAGQAMEAIEEMAAAASQEAAGAAALSALDNFGGSDETETEGLEEGEPGVDASEDSASGTPDAEAADNETIKPQPGEEVEPGQKTGDESGSELQKPAETKPSGEQAQAAPTSPAEEEQNPEPAPTPDEEPGAEENPAAEDKQPSESTPDASPTPTDTDGNAATDSNEAERMADQAEKPAEEKKPEDASGADEPKTEAEKQAEKPTAEGEEKKPKNVDGQEAPVEDDEAPEKKADAEPTLDQKKEPPPEAQPSLAPTEAPTTGSESKKTTEPGLGQGDITPGAEAEGQAADKDNKIKNCPRCGAPLEADDSCNHCGFGVKQRSAPTQALNALRYRPQLKKIDERAQALNQEIKKDQREVQKINDELRPVQTKRNLLQAAWLSFIAAKWLLRLLALLLFLTVIFFFLIPAAQFVYGVSSAVGMAATTLKVKIKKLDEEMEKKKEARKKVQLALNERTAEMRKLAVARARLLNQSMFAGKTA